MQNVLFIMTGSISCYKACEAISKLRREYNVQVVMTKSAKKFVGESTPEALTGKSVLIDTFEKGKALDHIHEIRKADVVVIAPATANFIGKIANGIADDLASTMILAHDYKKPILIAPSMNTFMLTNPLYLANEEKLKKVGYKFIDPASGTLACGEIGSGKLASPDSIYYAVKNELIKKENIKVLITSGGTRESIDDVRVLTNKSSGRTGSVIADYLYNQGCDVTYLGSKMGKFPDSPFIKKEEFQSFSNLKEKISDALKEHYDVIIHSAAVSDFSVKPTVGKLSSDKTPVLEFTKNEKIIDSLREMSVNKNVKIFGFKLTAKASPEEQRKAVEKLFSHAPNIDYVVLNDISQIDSFKHKAVIINKDLNEAHGASTKQILAKAICNIIIPKRKS